MKIIQGGLRWNKKLIKTNPYTNIANGWYMSRIGVIFSKSETGDRPLTYTFTVYVYYYQDGKITQTKVVTITK